MGSSKIVKDEPPPATANGNSQPQSAVEGKNDVEIKNDVTIKSVTMPSLSMSSDTQYLTPFETTKVSRIFKACTEGDQEALRELATSEGGLVDDTARRVAWPILLGCTDQQPSSDTDWTTLSKHRDEDQVELDVNRSFVYYPENEPRDRINERKHELSDVITAVLRHHPRLCYFQGYHDIVQVLLLVLGAQAAKPAVARLSLLRIRDFMLPTLAGAEFHLQLLPAIIHAADSDLYRHLSGATSPTPFFALAATLTLYAHDIEEYGDIARLFDFLLASEAVVPIYLFAVIVTSRKKELLEIDHDEPEMLHSILSKLPKPLNLESLIQGTSILLANHPPQRLRRRVWHHISSNSVLKTTREPKMLASQTLRDGEKYFDKQDTEIRRQEFRKNLRVQMHKFAYRYRRPLTWAGSAVFVAVLAVYFGSSTNNSAARDILHPVLSGYKTKALQIVQRILHSI